MNEEMRRILPTAPARSRPFERPRPSAAARSRSPAPRGRVGEHEGDTVAEGEVPASRAEALDHSIQQVRVTRRHPDRGHLAGPGPPAGALAELPVIPIESDVAAGERHGARQARDERPRHVAGGLVGGHQPLSSRSFSAAAHTTSTSAATRSARCRIEARSMAGASARASSPRISTTITVSALTKRLFLMASASRRDGRGLAATAFEGIARQHRVEPDRPLHGGDGRAVAAVRDALVEDRLERLVADVRQTLGRAELGAHEVVDAAATIASACSGRWRRGRSGSA